MDARRALLESFVVAAIGAVCVLVGRALPLAAPAGAVTFARATGVLQLDGTLQPALVGMNALTLTVQTADGQPVQGAEVEATWFPRDAGLTVTRPLDEDGAGRYSVRNLALTEAGRWQLLLVVQVADQRQLGTVDWVTGSGGDLRPTDNPLPRAAWIDGANAYGLPVTVAVFIGAVLIWIARVFNRSGSGPFAG